jgi:hypothetical protein
MGRKPLAPDDRVSERIPILVQPDEGVDIDSAAWRAGLSRSEWCRRHLVREARRELRKEMNDEGSVA